MNLEIKTWVKDGKYRMLVLGLLVNDSLLPSELSKKMNLNRASISRILKQLKEKKLVESISAGGRTVSYSITKHGKDIISRISEKNG